MWWRRREAPIEEDPADLIVKLARESETFISDKHLDFEVTVRGDLIVTEGELKLGFFVAGRWHHVTRDGWGKHDV